jgi:hypothetical protein
LNCFEGFEMLKMGFMLFIVPLRAFKLRTDATQHLLRENKWDKLMTLRELP